MDPLTVGTPRNLKIYKLLRTYISLPDIRRVNVFMLCFTRSLISLLHLLLEIHKSHGSLLTCIVFGKLETLTK